MELDLPIIIISTPIADEDVVTSLHAGAHDYIVKSNLARLNPAIERELHELAIHKEHARAQRALAASQRNIQQVTEKLQEVFWLIDCKQDEVIYLSPAYEEVWERPGKNFSADISCFLETIHPDDYADVKARFKADGWIGFSAEYRIQTPDGRTRWINTRTFPMGEVDGEPLQVASISSDVTRRYLLEEKNTILSRALEQSADAVMITTPEGIIEYVNETFVEVTGFCKDEAIGQSTKILKSGFQSAAFYEKVWSNLNEGLPYSDIFINRKKDGTLYYEAKTIAPVRDEHGDVTHFVSTGKDITERMKTKERLQKIIHYDSITGLANRILLTERLEQALIHARALDLRVGLLRLKITLSELLDGLDAFSLFESFICEVARRLERVNDLRATVARTGDEEFVVMLPQVEDDAVLKTTAEQILHQLNTPFHIDGYELYLVPKIGISIYPSDGAGAEQLLLHAKQAVSSLQGKEGQNVFFYSQLSKKGRSDNLSQ
jgi:PAS domain S-box-containing protein/diguanylate cyclase (GGDEF)-like protein